MKAILSVLSLLAALWLSAPFSIADEHCAIEGIEFASCSPQGRHFQSVVIALPGWNGSCEGTFGAAEGNLLNVMRERNFFDVDCFDYDTHDDEIEESRTALRERLQMLEDEGYREFILLTHSTGGILALDLLFAEAFDTAQRLRPQDDRSSIFRSDEGIKFRSLHSWAVPLNGVRDAVQLAGGVLVALQLSESILPLLSADSDYLKALKARIDHFDLALSDAPGQDKADYGFDWVIFQGQDDDWVVRNVSKDDDWFPEFLDVRVVKTESSHSHNVAASGEVGTPQFPGELMADKALLSLGLHPRTEAFFSETAQASPELWRQQRVVMNGVIAYAGIRNLFMAASIEVSNFVVRMLNGAFPRDGDFDVEVIAGLRGLLETKIHELDAQYAVHFGDRLLNDIEAGLMVAAPAPDSFGAGSYNAMRGLASVVRYIFEAVSKLVEADEALAAELRTSGQSLSTFQERAGRTMARLLAVEDDATQSVAMAGIVEFSSSARQTALVDPAFIDRLEDYTIRKYDKLNAAAKLKLGNVYVALSERSAEANTAALSILNNQVTWLQEQAPLWSAILTDEQLSPILSASVPKASGSPQTEFLGAVIARGGSDARSLPNSLGALRVYEDFISSTGQTAAEREGRRLFEASREAPLPAMRMEVDRALSRSGIAIEE